MGRQLLLVDDEENIVRALVRLLRKDGYTIHTANSGKEGLEVLKKNDIGVILSDQRMPEMNGVEFLREVKKLYPDTVRMVLSGYTDLQSVTDAINEGAIYKFLTKPWEDDLIRKNIEQAFQQFELVKENERLSVELKTANDELNAVNKELEKHVKRKTRFSDVSIMTLQVSQDMLENLPMGVVGIGEDKVIAVANLKAHEIIKPGTGCLVGFPVHHVLGEGINECYNQFIQGDEILRERIKHEQCGELDLIIKRMGKNSRANGVVLTMIPVEDK